MDMNERGDVLAQMLPQLSAHLRYALSNLHMAAASLAPAEEREQSAETDMRAAVLDQSYYQLLRIANNLSATAYFGSSEPLRMQERDIVGLVREICQRSGLLAEKIGLRLEFGCEKNAHVCSFNREALEQLVFQLLSNAFKYTPRGGSVTVELSVDLRQVRLSVTDTGCGIEPQRLQTLFEPCPTDELPVPPAGVGLGLPLCRRIAERHGGTVVAESRQGQGTCVTVALPNRQSGNVIVEDVPFDYSGGFNRTLLGLADALPASAFRIRQQD